MAFEPDRWADGEAGGTPITAAELNRIEAAGAAVETAPPQHQHAAADINSGTFAVARIPALAISRITGLQGALDEKATAAALADLVARVEALEEPEA